MPRPVFIVCSKSGADDHGALSLFEIIDRINYTQLKAPTTEKVGPIIIESTQIRITAVWMREAGDEGKTFDVEFYATLTPQASRFEMGREQFSFTQPFFRSTGVVRGLLPFLGEGVLWISCRIREVGGGDWVEQKYPILIELIKDPISVPNQPMPTPGGGSS